MKRFASGILLIVLTSSCATMPPIQLEPPDFRQDGLCILALLDIAGGAVTSNAVAVVTAIATDLPVCGPVVRRGVKDLDLLVRMVIAHIEVRRELRRRSPTGSPTLDAAIPITIPVPVTIPIVVTPIVKPEVLTKPVDDEKQEITRTDERNEQLLRDIMNAIGTMR